MIRERREKAGILVPLDGSRQSMAALPIAKTLASITGAILHVVYAAEEAEPLDRVRAHLGLSDEDMVGAVLYRSSGDPVDVILRISEERSSLLIVMATHSGHPHPEAGLGHVAQAILVRSTAPVLLVPPDHYPEPWHLQVVVLPQDGTPEAAAAVEPAAHLARHVGASLNILHVSKPGARPPGEPGTLTLPRYLDQPQYEWPSWSEEFVERIRAMSHLPEDIGLRFFLARGEAGDEIVRIAREQQADLLVLPWHGSLEPERAATLKAVFREAPCPMLVLAHTAVPRLRDLEGPLRRRASLPLEPG